MHIHKFADIASFAEIGGWRESSGNRRVPGIHQKAPPYTVPDRTADSSVIRSRVFLCNCAGKLPKGL